MLLKRHRHLKNRVTKQCTLEGCINIDIYIITQSENTKNTNNNKSILHETIKKNNNNLNIREVKNKEIKQ